VTATPPTPNGDLHLGHLSGPYLRADVYSRALRMRGVEAYYLTGIDDHQSYVALKGERVGMTADEAADHFGALMAASLRSARIHPDLVVRPRRSAHHVPFVQEFFARLLADGHLVLRDAAALFCDGCREFIFEAYASGACPHCGSGSGGNACEVCGRPNDCADLGGARCNRCGEAPSVRSYPRLYFPLAPWTARLREYWASAHMGPHLASLCERMVADGLPEVAVSHAAEWGIPVPAPGPEGQRIYVWFEMAAGYLAATLDLARAKGLDGGWEPFWKEPGTPVVQFFGFDNGYFHAVLFPALFFAYDGRIRPPSTFVTNEFYRLEGLKFSTSRGHAIWGQDFLARVPADAVRFHLALTGPETEQTNFGADEFAGTVRGELAGRWGEWLERLGAAVRHECGGAAPAPGAWTHEHHEFLARLRGWAEAVDQAYQARTFSPARAARTLAELVAGARRFGAAEEHWRGVREGERRTGLALELAAARTLALLAAPLMPDFAAALWCDLGHGDPLEAEGWEGGPALPLPGRPVRLGAPEAETAAVFAAWAAAAP
jgi:methionyl-tRNA synthetase